MPLTADTPLQLGDLLLSLDETGEAPGHGVAIPLGAGGDVISSWISAGGLLAAQAMAPAAAFPAHTRKRLSFLGMGPGSAMAAYIAVCMEIGHVEIVLHPNDVDAFQNLVARRNSPTEVRKLSRVEDATDGAFHDMVAFGCDGKVPESLRDAGPLVRRMRTEGQLLIFGFPADEIKNVFDRAAKKGLSLRAMGNRDDLAFLCGSLEHQNQFA
ncbi:MAG: hypothetical protein COA70_10450 [Planctomycetota bacterium]|nr:MAG: hypothetical protein COA70_10450 [Planctomycetota bacterium]